jgi:hypothetical protein
MSRASLDSKKQPLEAEYKASEWPVMSLWNIVQIPSCTLCYYDTFLQTFTMYRINIKIAIPTTKLFYSTTNSCKLPLRGTSPFSLVTWPLSPDFYHFFPIHLVTWHSHLANLERSPLCNALSFFWTFWSCDQIRRSFTKSSSEFGSHDFPPIVL